MYVYSGFEQTGMLGSTIISNDSRIDVITGDIDLYNLSQISIFYNNSSRSYTKLCHINLIKNELRNLLDIDIVVVTLALPPKNINIIKYIFFKHNLKVL